MNAQQVTRVGVVGTGFLASGLVSFMGNSSWLEASTVLTRRDPATCTQFPRPDLLTNSLEQLIAKSDLIVECSGDVIHATEVVERCVEAGLPVVTMDAEFHATTGSYFVGRGLVSEAEGDQPGSLAALKEEVELMGFKPLAYCNVKGFMNLNPSPEDMQYWSQRIGYSIQQTTSFTDGTKLHVEQALVANGLGAGLLQDGMTGPTVETMEEGAAILGELAAKNGYPVSDYVVGPKVPPGVFIVATHAADQRSNLRSYKLGDGPYYAILRPYHLCYFEMPKTIRRVLEGRGPLLDNSAFPRVGVAAIAKRAVRPGEVITRGIGSFEARGEAVTIAAHPDHVPVGLLANARVKEAIEPGQMITFGDVELPDSLALRAWLAIRERVTLPAAFVPATADFPRTVLTEGATMT